MPHSNQQTVTLWRTLAAACLICSPAIVGCDYLDVAQPLPVATDSADYSVLFIGSSYLGYNNFTWTFEQLAREAGKTVFVGERIVYGASLQYHATSMLTTQAIRDFDWDFVVLQGSSYAAGYPDGVADSVLPALEELTDEIAANGSGSRAVYMMGWAYEDGLTWDDGSADSFAEMQQKIYDNTLNWADSLGMIVAPVGWAWRETLQATTEEQYLHSADLSHPNVRGSYLNACVFVATLFGMSVSGTEYFAGLPESIAGDLQDLGSQIVLDNQTLWNLDPAGAAAQLSSR